MTLAQYRTYSLEVIFNFNILWQTLFNRILYDKLKPYLKEDSKKLIYLKSVVPQFLNKKVNIFEKIYSIKKVYSIIYSIKFRI
jgi:hypothetical protein